MNVSNNSVIEEFDGIKQSTHCAFAPTARLQGNVPWKPEVPFSENLQEFYSNLIDFCNDAHENKLDGIVLQLPPDYSKTINALATTAWHVLSFLAKHDTTRKNALTKDIDQPGWKFRFNDMVFHVLCFGLCYDKNHPRNTNGTPYTFMLFQPECSFVRWQDHTGFIPTRLKEATRAAFFRNNQEYDVALATQTVSSLKFVKPLQINEPPVLWWEYNDLHQHYKHLFI